MANVEVINFFEQVVKFDNTYEGCKHRYELLLALKQTVFTRKLATGNKEVKLINAWLNKHYDFSIGVGGVKIGTFEGDVFLNNGRNILVHTCRTIGDDMGGSAPGWTTIYGDKDLIKQIFEASKVYKKQIKDVQNVEPRS